MRRQFGRLAAACALAVATAVFCGSAVAGGGHGNGNNGDNGNGNGNGGGAPQTQPQSQAQPQSGVKPSSTTKHWTHTTAGASPDVSKRYGNGTTAAEIAKSRGAPASQPLTGPGNSQPHKTYDCRHKDNPSGGVDVHAIKNYSSNVCAPTTQPQPVPQAPPAPRTVTICHATGSSTNPYVEISVDVNALKNGHTTAKGDIIPAPAGGCPTPPVPAAPAIPSVTFCANGALMTQPANVVVASYLTGPNIVPPFAYNGRTYSENWPSGEATFNNHCVAPLAAQVGPAAVTTTAPAPTASVAPVAVTTTVAAAAPTPAAPAKGGVLGAEATLTKPAARLATRHGGVLGTVTHLAGSTLPFTGFPVWLAVLIAISLILAGVTLRRRALGTRS